VVVYAGSIFDLPADALVSPANSFGFMDGGIDMALSMRLGWHVQTRVREAIARDFSGELLVGQALIIETDHVEYPYLFSAPTMRTPTRLGPQTVNPYLAFRAVLLLWRDGALSDGSPIRETIRTIAAPGLGTGVGQVPPTFCARQMRQAYDDILGEEPFSAAESRTWLEIDRHRQALFPGGAR
jgi:O-acetyl-ADP-ribose deacetylase (regulator of RNase III)